MTTSTTKLKEFGKTYYYISQADLMAIVYNLIDRKLIKVEVLDTKLSAVYALRKRVNGTTTRITQKMVLETIKAI